MPKVTMLCGGVGGARAALALQENWTDCDLSFIVNTGDDFEHLGLEIWPDWDSVFYHLAGIGNLVQGWGRGQESHAVMEELGRLGGPTWFQLGDKDLAWQLYRSWSLKQGHTRAELAIELGQKWDLKAQVLPVTEGSLATKLLLENGQILDFQDWFVKEQGKPKVQQVLSSLSPKVNLSQGVVEALQKADVLLFAPSNPYLSLSPMLAHPDFAQAIKSLSIPKIAVSPLLGGKAVKGPLDSLIASLSPHLGQNAIAHFWEDWADALVMPAPEHLQVETRILKVLACPTVLAESKDRAEFTKELRKIWHSW